MRKFIYALLLLLCSFSTQVSASDSTKVFVLQMYDDQIHGRYDELIKSYHSDDVKYLGKYILQTLRCDSQMRETFFGDIDPDDIPDTSYSSLCAKFIKYTNDEIFTGGVKIDTVEFLGEVPISDSTFQSIVRIRVSKDTIKVSTKAMMTIQKYQGSYKVRFEDEFIQILSRFNLDYNDSKSSIDNNFNLKDKLLYIGYPDVEREYQLSSQNSEIMAYDTGKNEVIRITKDLCYDSTPSFYPDGSKIFFDSKRPYNGMLALNGDSHIFYIDLKTKKIKRYDKKLYDLFPGKLGTECERPVWSKDRKLYFVTASYDTNKNQSYHILYEFDETKEALTFIDSAYFSPKLSANSRYLYYYTTTYGNYDNYNSHIVYDKLKNEKIILPDTLRKYSFVDWLPEHSTTMLFQLMEKDTLDARIVRYSLESGKISFDTLKDIRGSLETLGSSDNMLFLIKKDEKNYKEDIWSYNLDTKEFRKLTNDGKVKEELIFYR